MIVGFIGLGTMGPNAAFNVRRARFATVVHDIREAAADPLIEKGAARDDVVDRRQPKALVTEMTMLREPTVADSSRLLPIPVNRRIDT